MDHVWETAQREELKVWERTAAQADAVLSELAEVAGLVAFGSAAGVPATGEAIELGIGPLGVGWAALCPGVTRSVGIDPLPRLDVTTGLEALDEFVRTLQATTEFLQLDATRRLPFDDGSFDVVVCDNVVDHAQEPRAILGEAHRLLRPGGWLLFGVNVFSRVGIVKWRQVTTRLHPDDPNTLCHPHSFTFEEAHALVESSGFTVSRETAATTKTRLAGRAYRYRAVARRT